MPRFLDGARHTFFGSLSADARRRIADYVSEPSLFKWAGGWREAKAGEPHRYVGTDGKRYVREEGVVSVIIGQKGEHSHNIYTAVVDLDPSYRFVDGQLLNFPDGMLVMRAIKEFCK